MLPDFSLGPFLLTIPLAGLLLFSLTFPLPSEFPSFTAKLHAEVPLLLVNRTDGCYQFGCRV
jgi:hypothetical protein